MTPCKRWCDHQEIPWVDQPLEYVQKFRFYYQPYNASYHTNVKRTTWGIASPVEYDVPKCAEGVMGCSQARDLDAFRENLSFVLIQVHEQRKNFLL